MINTPNFSWDALAAVFRRPAATETTPDGRTQAPTVLFVDQTGQLGGAELALLPLAAAFAGRGEVVLLADGPFRERLQAVGVRVRVIHDERVSNIDRARLRCKWLEAIPGMFGQIRAVARAARSFDILFLNTQKALVLGSLAKVLHHRPIVWFLHDILSPAHFGPAQLMIVKFLARHAVDHIVANSRASAEALIALTGLPSASVPVVHNGIDASAFLHSETDDIRALRARLGLPETACLAGLFGRLAPWKGQHVAIEALVRLSDVHLIVVGAALFGEGDYAKKLRHLAHRLGVEDRVHFAGFREDVPEWMKAMDIILHTSTEPEPFGRVIIEGMAAGRPVVAAGGVLEIIRHKENGWLVEPGDVTGLAEAIETLRAAPDLARDLANNARIDVERQFSLENYLQRMAGIIDSAKIGGVRNAEGAVEFATGRAENLVSEPVIIQAEEARR